MRARVLDVLLAEENRKWITLAAVSFGLFMIMLDNTVVNVALPTMQRDLHVSVSQLEWVVIAYALTFASLLITGGKLADLYGRRRIFVLGLAIFTLSSLACGLASSAGELGRQHTTESRQAEQEDPGRAAVRAARAREHHPHEKCEALGDVGGLGGAAGFEVVRPEVDHHRVERAVRGKARRQVVGAPAVRRERVVEHRRATGQSFLDDVPAVPQLPREHAGPPDLATEAAACLTGDRPVRVGVAEAEHGAVAHGASLGSRN